MLAIMVVDLADTGLPTRAAQGSGKGAAGSEADWQEGRKR